MDKPREEQARGILLADPDLPWPGIFPYETLRRAGIDPFSNAREVTNALFNIKGRASREDRDAWDALRIPAKRLHVDFFLYHLAPPEAGEPDLPPPLEFPAACEPNESTPDI